MFHVKDLIIFQDKIEVKSQQVENSSEDAAVKGSGKTQGEVIFLCLIFMILILIK